jgi:hypothetical protein
VEHLPRAVLQRQMRQRGASGKANPEEEQNPPWLPPASATRKTDRETRRTLFSLLLNDGWNGAILPAVALARVRRE